jgi:hypothetical protein
MIGFGSHIVTVGLENYRYQPLLLIENRKKTNELHDGGRLIAYRGCSRAAAQRRRCYGPLELQHQTEAARYFSLWRRSASS